MFRPTSVCSSCHSHAIPMDLRLSSRLSASFPSLSPTAPRLRLRPAVLPAPGRVFLRAHRWDWPGTRSKVRTGCCDKWRTCRCKSPKTTCARTKGGRAVDRKGPSRREEAAVRRSAADRPRPARDARPPTHMATAFHFLIVKRLGRLRVPLGRVATVVSTCERVKSTSDDHERDWQDEPQQPPTHSPRPAASQRARSKRAEAHIHLGELSHGCGRACDLGRATNGRLPGIDGRRECPGQRVVKTSQAERAPRGAASPSRSRAGPSSRGPADRGEERRGRTRRHERANGQGGALPRAERLQGEGRRAPPRGSARARELGREAETKLGLSGREERGWQGVRGPSLRGFFLSRRLQTVFARRLPSKRSVGLRHFSTTRGNGGALRAIAVARRKASPERRGGRIRVPQGKVAFVPFPSSKRLACPSFLGFSACARLHYACRMQTVGAERKNRRWRADEWDGGAEGRKSRAVERKKESASGAAAERALYARWKGAGLSTKTKTRERDEARRTNSHEGRRRANEDGAKRRDEQGRKEKRICRPTAALHVRKQSRRAWGRREKRSRGGGKRARKASGWDAKGFEFEGAGSGARRGAALSRLRRAPRSGRKNAVAQGMGQKGGHIEERLGKWMRG